MKRNGVYGMKLLFVLPFGFLIFFFIELRWDGKVETEIIQFQKYAAELCYTMKENE